MESIYYVMSWLCHRTCPHCYEDRFRPYHGVDLEKVVSEARSNYSRVIDNFPGRMTYLDLSDTGPDGQFREKPGRVILAGGEILLDAVRESVLYPALELLHDKYSRNGGVRLIVQTTGDLLTESIIGELLEHHVWMISISGVDAFHAGLEEEAARQDLQGKVAGMMDRFGVREQIGAMEGNGPFYHFFGATPESWIGKIWPRGRAWTNGLSRAGINDNFCNAWSGGLNFLAHQYSGSEVSVDPAGNVFPCCMKTKLPVGNLREEPLLKILDRLQGDPVFEAISMGHPERMGLRHGWSVEKFLQKSRTEIPSGGVYQNLCIGCDRFHEEVLSTGALVQIASQRA